jgi:signal transduction histidine kinase
MIVEPTKTLQQSKKGRSRRNKHAQMRRRLAATQKYAQQLKKLNRLQAEFIANVSHEFRTPLNGILGYAELLQDGLYGTLTPEQREVLDHIRVCGYHLLDLVNEILDLSRLKKHQIQLEWELVSPVELIEAAAAAVQPLAKQRRLNLMTTCEPDLPLLRLDFRRIYQVLLNLLSNAIKFTNEGGVEVGARREGNSVRFHVKDTGIGIAPEFSPFVFKEFQQQHSTATQPFGGVGLGLSLTKRLVELHGGKISYLSEENQGTEFYFHLPLPSQTDIAATSLEPTLLAYPQDNKGNAREPTILSERADDEISGRVPTLIPLSSEEVSQPANNLPVQTA